jgi:hypothetical protein
VKRASWDALKQLSKSPIKGTKPFFAKSEAGLDIPHKLYLNSNNAEDVERFKKLL